MITRIVIALAIAIGLISFPSPVAIEEPGCGDHICNCFEHGDSVECDCWVCFEDEAYSEAKDEFTALFNSYETKWAKNGRLMIRQGDSGSFKFVKKG